MKQITNFSTFDLKLKTQVYDKFTGKYGFITSIRETSPEWVAAFVKWEDKMYEEELCMYLPNIYVLDEMETDNEA